MPTAKTVAKKKEKVILRVVQFPKALVTQVLFTDPRFVANSNSNSYREFTASNGFMICSSAQPDMGSGGMKLWGTSTNKNDYVSVVRFSTTKERDEYIQKMTEGLKEWSQTWEGFVDYENIDPSSFKIKTEESDLSF